MYTQLPYDVDLLSREELIGLLRRVTAERDELATEVQRKSKKQKTDSVNPIQYAYYPAAPVLPMAPEPSFDTAAIKKRILKSASAKIKKTVHTDRNKPYTEVLECVPNESAVNELMQGFTPKSNTYNMIKWLLNEEEVLDWLDMRDAPLIHPVTNKINTICLFGEKPNIYAHAKIETLEIKWDRKSGAFNMKFRTLIAGFGKPGFFSPK